MSLFHSLFGFWNAPSPTELARQVAQRSYALVRDLVEGRTWAMSRAEARGYVRAKAGPVIRAEIAALIQRSGRLGEHGQSSVFALASDRVIQSVLADIGREQARQRDAKRAA
ncbi:MAG TPA: hypothetical protein VMV69_09990 [Pirellulales bacterium]|nr:hypothetical protein [Pirellulales bacterium]